MPTIPRPDGATLRSDAVAGVTVAVMLVPQAMAYAALAGLPPVAGLYASVVPLVAYALVGTSGQLAMGPAAIISLLTASAVAPLADGDPGRYAALAALLALMAGALQLALGLVRAGVFVAFLSHAVIVGFAAGAAFLIAGAQLDVALGIDVPRAQTVPEVVAAVGGAIQATHPLTLALTVAGMALLVVAKRLVPRVPGPLLLTVAGIAAAVGLDLGERGVALVGEVPAGLPLPALPDVVLGDAVALLPGAVAIAVIGYAENISIAKALGAGSRRRLDPDRELLGAGAANAAAGLFAAFPVAGSFSRSAVQRSAGARTPLTAAVTAAVVLAALLLLAPLLEPLPRAALAAIVLVAVAALVDVGELRTIARTSRGDAATVVVTFAATVLLGVELGLAVGVGWSLALFLWRTSRPHVAELGRVEGTRLLRNVRRWPVRRDPRVAVLRVDGPLYFANAARIGDLLRALPAERPELEGVVLDASAISAVDADGAHTLRRVSQELASAGVALHLGTVRGPVRDVLRRVDAELVARCHATSEGAVAAVAGPDSPLLEPDDDEVAPERVL